MRRRNTGPLGEVEYEGGQAAPESRGGRAREEEEAHDTDTGLFHIDEHGNKVPRRCRVGAVSSTIATCNIPTAHLSRHIQQTR